MRPYFAKVSIGTGFEPVLNWFQSTALTARLQLPQRTVANVLDGACSADMLSSHPCYGDRTIRPRTIRKKKN